MKILFAIKRLENMAGGAERVFLQIANGLKDCGYDIEILSFDKTASESFYPVHKLLWHKIPIGDNSKPSNFLEMLKRIAQLKKTCKSINPDIIVAFQYSMMLPVTLSLPRAPVIGSDHIVPQHYDGRPLDYLAALLSAFLCRKITVVTPSIRQMYPSFFRKKIIAISNPVKVDGTCANVRGEEGKKKILLSVGRLELQKDPVTLIKAFSLVSAKFPDWNLIIAGEGSLRAGLEKLIQELQLVDRISLPGASKNIDKNYESAQIFALASTYESFGLATVEAMSAGLPVIGFSDCPGTNEIIKHRSNGILVNPGNSERYEALAAGLEELMANEDLRVSLGNNGHNDARKYDLNSVLDQWKEMIETITIRNSSGPSATA